MNKMASVHTADGASVHVKVTAAQAGDEIYPLPARGQEAESGMAASSLLPFLRAEAVRPVSTLAPLQPPARLPGNEPDPSQAPARAPCLFLGQNFP